MFHGVTCAEFRGEPVLEREFSISVQKDGATENIRDQGARIANDACHYVG